MNEEGMQPKGGGGTDLRCCGGGVKGISGGHRRNIGKTGVIRGLSYKSEPGPIGACVTSGKHHATVHTSRSGMYLHQEAGGK